MRPLFIKPLVHSYAGYCTYIFQVYLVILCYLVLISKVVYHIPLVNITARYENVLHL